MKIISKLKKLKRSEASSPNHYFSGLNYSLANEDSRIERDMVLEFSTALAVCGSGSRAFSLIHDKLDTLIIVDISSSQIEFARLKWELIRQLSYEDYLAVMGYVEATMGHRCKILDTCVWSESTKIYLKSIPKSAIENGLIYSGRWESKLIRLGRWITTLTGHDFRQNFIEPKSNPQGWPRRRLSFWIYLLANRFILNRFLYKGQMVKSNQNGVAEFLIKNFEDCFLKNDPKNYFFQQMLFLGKIEFRPGLPIDVHEDVFLQIKRFKGTIEFHVMDLNRALKNFDFQFGSFSNVPSYFHDSEIGEFETTLSTQFKLGSLKIAVIRSFLKHRSVQHPDLMALVDKTSNDAAEIKDSTQLYRFQILQKL